MNTPFHGDPRPGRHDRLRAWLDAAMSADDVRELEAEFAADPAFAEAANEFRDVWRATESLARMAPVSTTTWSELEARAERDAARRRWRRVAAALVLVSSAAYFGFRAALALAKGGGAEAVVIEEIPLAPREVPTVVHAPVPDVLAEFTPVQDGKVRWLESIDEARGVSEAVGRPLLVFGYVPGCPWCKTLREEQFTDGRFQELAARCVPVALDLLAIDESISAPLMERGYPAIELQTERGEFLHDMSGPPGTVDVVAELAKGLARWPAEPPALAWSTANDLARMFVSASASERQGRLSDAWRDFETLARDGGGYSLTFEGFDGIARIEDAAMHVLLDARTRASSDAVGARAELERASRAFADTPFERDLRRVLERWKPSAPFPALSAPDS